MKDVNLANRKIHSDNEIREFNSYCDRVLHELAHCWRETNML